MQTQSGEIHGLRRTIKSRTDEVNDLQLALEDAKLFLFDEREQVLKLQAENDNLKVQEIEDRKRIQELLALTQPLAQEVRARAVALEWPRTVSPHPRPSLPPPACSSRSTATRAPSPSPPPRRPPLSPSRGGAASPFGHPSPPPPPPPQTA
jgi:coiled-coil domain-containing protein 77